MASKQLSYRRFSTLRIIDVVEAVIINESGQVLRALPSPNMSLPGKWEFPDGKIEANETDEDTLVREIREELACEIAVDRFITECLHDYPNITVRLYTYYASVVSEQPVAREHERIEWVNRVALTDLDWAPRTYLRFKGSRMNRSTNASPCPVKILYLRQWSIPW